MKSVTLKTWLYAVPAASTRGDRINARSQMLPIGAIVDLKEERGDLIIVSAKSSVYGTVLAPVSRRDVTF